MQKIFVFIYRHLTFFVFLILEVIALALLANRNSFQQSVVFRVGTVIAAHCYEVTAAVSGYFGLRETNKLLAEKNVSLLNRVEYLEEQISLLTKDSVNICSVDADLVYIGADVVYNSVYRLQNYIIIDKGHLQGIEEDMGVVSPQGVVGVVQRVSDNYAVVIPLINPEQRISAKIRGNGQLGSIVWNGVSSKKVMLEEVPSHVSVQKGDVIVTSGFSAIFPEGLPVGTVSNVETASDWQFSVIEVETAVDFQSLDYVVVTAYRSKPELNALHKSICGNEK